MSVVEWPIYRTIGQYPWRVIFAMWWEPSSWTFGLEFGGEWRRPFVALVLGPLKVAVDFWGYDYE